MSDVYAVKPPLYYFCGGLGLGGGGGLCLWTLSFINDQFFLTSTNQVNNTCFKPRCGLYIKSTEAVFRDLV